MKILHVAEYADGGVATYLKEVLKYQKSSSFIEEVNLLTSDYKSDEFKEFPDVVKRYKYKRDILGILQAAYIINKKIKEFSPDIIHVHSTFAGLIVRSLYLLKLNRNYKIIYCSHGWSFLMEVSNWKKKVYLCVEKCLSLVTDKIINISKFEHNVTQDLNFSSNKIELINNGISNNQKKIYLEDKNIVMNKSKINILFVGRYDRQKGIDILVDFFSNYHNENIQLYTIGRTVLGDQKISFPDSVTDLGWINNDAINYYYKKADIVIIPSRWEGFGLVALEAMRNKKPLIVSNKGNLPNFINGNGYVFNLEDLSSLERILNTLEKNELKVMGEKSYSIFNKQYTSEEMNARIINLYNELTEKSV